jgi:hypothetical protein
LTLLSGTTITLLKIDNHKIDEEGYFTNKLINKLRIILKNSEGTSMANTIKIKAKKIISDCIRYLATNYGPISDIFFEWYLKEM